MAIKTNYNFKGIEIPNATIRVIRIFGSSKEGWNSLVGVYYEDNLTEEFNHSVNFKEDERGYVTIYKSLTDKYGGVMV